MEIFKKEVNNMGIGTPEQAKDAMKKTEQAAKDQAASNIRASVERIRERQDRDRTAQQLPKGK